MNENYEGWNENNVRIFFSSKTIITVVLKFVYFMGVSFTKLMLFFHKLSFVINTLFHLCVRCSMPVT